METTPRPLEPIAEAHDMVLLTRKRSGDWVPTPVNPVVERGQVLFRTWRESGKAKRLRNNRTVRFAASTRRGEPTSEMLEGEATLLQGPASEHAAALINRRYPLLQGIAVRVFHRLRGLHTQHYAITRITPDPLAS